MNFVKVTTSGQITLPKQFRQKFDTDCYAWEIVRDAVVFRPVELKRYRRKKAKYTMKDLLAFKIKSKHPNESLVDQIDHIVYGI